MMTYDLVCAISGAVVLVIVWTVWYWACEESDKDCFSFSFFFVFSPKPFSIWNHKKTFWLQRRMVDLHADRDLHDFCHASGQQHYSIHKNSTVAELSFSLRPDGPYRWIQAICRSNGPTCTGMLRQQVIADTYTWRTGEIGGSRWDVDVSLFATPKSFWQYKDQNKCVLLSAARLWGNPKVKYIKVQ